MIKKVTGIVTFGAVIKAVIIPVLLITWLI